MSQEIREQAERVLLTLAQLNWKLIDDLPPDLRTEVWDLIKEIATNRDVLNDFLDKYTLKLKAPENPRRN